MKWPLCKSKMWLSAVGRCAATPKTCTGTAKQVIPATQENNQNSLYKSADTFIKSCDKISLNRIFMILSLYFSLLYGYKFTTGHNLGYLQLIWSSYLKNTLIEYKNSFFHFYQTKTAIVNQGGKVSYFGSTTSCIEYMYRVFVRRVNTFVTSYFQFFYNIKIATNEFTNSKFCENSEYAHFKKVKLS